MKSKWVIEVAVPGVETLYVQVTATGFCWTQSWDRATAFKNQEEALEYAKTWIVGPCEVVRQ